MTETESDETETESDKPETVRVNFVIPEPKRDKWDEYVGNQPEIKSRTDLIVRAVEHEIAGQSGQNGSQSDEVALQVAGIADKMEDLMSRFGSVETRLQSLEAKSRTDEDLNELTTQVSRVLPDEKPGSRAWEEERQNRHSQLQAAELGEEDISVDMAEKHCHAWEGTVEGLAKALDRRESRIEDALDKLKEETYMIRETEIDGETHYYK